VHFLKEFSIRAFHLGKKVWLGLPVFRVSRSMPRSFKEDVNDTFENRYIYSSVGISDDLSLLFTSTCLNTIYQYRMIVHYENNVKALRINTHRSVDFPMHFERRIFLLCRSIITIHYNDASWN